MKDDKPFHRFTRIFYFEKMDDSMRRTVLGRVISMLSFITVILCLGSWVTVFFLLRNTNVVNSISPNLLSNFTCFAFFGGLILAVFIGALIGNALRRRLWKTLVRKRQ